ncbi:LytTr DNA-binding domain-containing protein [Arcicella aurantiaca]|uniref:LytTr DNA-binding domain-containing protein n=1 Tax=Arcicella aurantiaca TaxID=591202 RepID=A0A316E7G0_9BACT|nr:LytTR family DNA-binding domain-containing protein [Arcicella aurantiaca]PWK18900.1 LytTr DNA-binding domain-containing protein [Arcicella aurantiaca]
MNSSTFPVVFVKNNQLLLYKEKLKISISEIILLEAHKNYTCLYICNGKRLVVPKTLKLFEDLLINHKFYRIHRTFLINYAHLKNYNADLGEVYLTQNIKAVASRRRKLDFEVQINYLS